METVLKLSVAEDKKKKIVLKQFFILAEGPFKMVPICHRSIDYGRTGGWTRYRDASMEFSCLQPPSHLGAAAIKLGKLIEKVEQKQMNDEEKKR